MHFNFFTQRKPIKSSIFIIILGLIQGFSFDFKFDSSFITLAGLSSLLSLCLFLAFICQQNSLKKILFFSYLYGICFLGWGLDWIYISMANYGGANLVFAILANIAVVLYLSLYWLVAAALIYQFKSPSKRLIVAPLIIASLEWIRSYFLIGFPWLSLGYAQISTPLAKLSTIGGVHFVSLIVLTIASLLTYLGITQKNRLAIFKKQLPVYVALMALIITGIYQNKGHLSENKKVAILQGNINVITKFDIDKMDHSLVTYLELTSQASTKSPDLIIWPETAIPYFYQQSLEIMDLLKRYQNNKHYDLVSGIPFIDDKDRIFNAIVFQPEDNNQNNTFYYKENLLPFGEYLPFRNVFSFFKDFVDIPMSDFSRGEIIQPPFQSHDFLIAPSICFEAVFGDRIRLNAKNADVMLNISNDGWFGHSKAQLQHLNIARMRAIENNKYLLRATNNGISAIIDNHGKVTQTIAQFQKGIVNGHFGLQKKLTIYARFGDHLFIFLIVFAGIIIGLYFKISSQITQNKK